LVIIFDRCREYNRKTMDVRAWLEGFRRRPRRLIYAALGLLGIYLILRGCVPALRGSRLPASVVESIQERYTVCISPQDTPIFPGEPRQPECGDVTIKELGLGTPSDQARAQGVTKAVCYRATVENPYWTTLGTTRHEVAWEKRTASKVAVLQNGVWTTYPDEDRQDRQRWADYACPGDYE
jgi:hypothetical protein